MFGQTFSVKSSTEVSTRPTIPCKRPRSDSLIESDSLSLMIASNSDMDFEYDNLCDEDEDDDIEIILDPSDLDQENKFIFEICNISTS
ncbi:hypothetical protein CLU79DRAFT_831699 [Phycomyces nitens]|nr:hypothetical protein CLU79DRAFT_831699 [Phycomyces nitens]